MKRFIKVAVLIVILAIGGELTARALFDFPLYDADADVGYWPVPSQHGNYLLTHDWEFNSDSLGVAEEFTPSERFDVLLVGDSVVYGGNPYAQSEKLGPTLEHKSGWQVWPASAGSWGMQNELAFLRRKPKLAEGADAIVFVFNSGDFGKPSEWRSPYTHPRQRPALYIPYLINRYLLPPSSPAAAPYPVAQRDILRDWLEFDQAAQKPIYVVAYEAEAETGSNCGWVPEAFRQVGTWICYDGTAELGSKGFIDGIHPSPQGNQILAGRIADMVAAGLASDAADNSGATGPILEH